MYQTLSRTIMPMYLTLSLSLTLSLTLTTADASASTARSGDTAEAASYSRRTEGTGRGAAADAPACPQGAERTQDIQAEDTARRARNQVRAYVTKPVRANETRVAARQRLHTYTCAQG